MHSILSNAVLATVAFAFSVSDAFAQYSVAVTTQVYTDLTGAAPLTYISSEGGYYYQTNFIFPVFDSKDANFNLSVPNGSNGAFISPEGYVAVYESPDYDNTVAFQCLYDSDFKYVAGLTEVSAKVEGLVGNRIAKFQWKNVVNGTDTSQLINFQAWLYEADSSIAYHYGPNTFSSNANQARCGIVVIDPSFANLINQCNAEGNPLAPSVYDSITTWSLPTLDSIPASGTVITFRIAATTTTDVHSAPSNTAFSFYPNPAKDQLFIQAGGDDVIHIYSLQGQQLKQFHCSMGLNMFELHSLSSGVYILRTDMGRIRLLTIEQ